MCYAYPLSYAFHIIKWIWHANINIIWLCQRLRTLKNIHWYITAINITPLIGFMIIFNFWNYLKSCASSLSNKAAYRYLFLLTVLMWYIIRSLACCFILKNHRTLCAVPASDLCLAQSALRRLTCCRCLVDSKALSTTVTISSEGHVAAGT